jgi:heat shock protein HslJ
MWPTMLSLRSSLVTLVLATSFAVGCSDQPAGPTALSRDSGTSGLTANQIAGNWTVVSIRPQSEAEQVVPSGATYALSVIDGRVSTKADCNVCGGSLVVGGETLTIGPLLACTRAACSTMAFESAYIGILSGDSTARLDGESLTLTSARGDVRFRRIE